MKTVNTKLLKEFNKWRRGKGKKYQAPGVPFDLAEVGKELDNAIAVADVAKTIGPIEVANVIVLAHAGLAAFEHLTPTPTPTPRSENGYCQSLRDVERALMKLVK